MFRVDFKEAWRRLSWKTIKFSLLPLSCVVLPLLLALASKIDFSIEGLEY